MKFSCEKALLLSAITIASRAVSPKSSVVALEGILIEAQNDLRLTGYDLEKGIRTVVPAEIQEQGSLVLSSRLFGDIIRKLPDDVVVFTSNDYTVNIKCGMSEFNIIGTDAEEFPELPLVEYQNTIEIGQNALREMIGGTVFAVSENESRPIHTGSLFECNAEGLTVVSIDGYRLALRHEAITNKTGDDEFSFVVPGNSLKEVMKICGDTDESIMVVQGGRHIMFKVGDTMLITRRLEGKFLDYKTAIPRNNSIVITGEKRDLIESIDRVSLMINEKLKSPLRCKFSQNVLNISTKTAIGNAYDQCPISGDGKDLEIGFNNKYMMDALRACPVDTVKIELSSGVAPCIIVPTDGEEKFLYMVLPVRLKAGE